MNKRVLLNLSLVLLLAALGAVAWLRPGQPPATPPATLGVFDAGSIERIEIARADADRVVIEKSGDQWQLTAPLRVPADKFLVDSLLGLATATVHARFAADTVELAQFMLDRPRIIARFDEREISFGETDALSGRRYILSDDIVYLIDDTVFRLISGDPVTLMSRQLLPADAQIDALVLPEHRVSRGENQQWTVSPPVENLSQDDAIAWIDEWRRAQAIRVSLAGPPAGSRSAEVLIAGAAAPLRFELVQTDSEWLLIRRDLGVRYHFTENQFRRLVAPRHAVAAEP